MTKEELIKKLINTAKLLAGAKRETEQIIKVLSMTTSYGGMRM